jgi:hypothetical protein
MKPGINNADAAQAQYFAQRVSAIDDAVGVHLERANLPVDIKDACDLGSKITVFPNLMVVGGGDDSKKNDMFRQAEVFVIVTSECFTSIDAISAGERYTVREMMMCSTKIQVVFTAGRNPTLLCHKPNAANRSIKLSDKLMIMRKVEEGELLGYRLSPTRVQWQALVESGVTASVLHCVRKAHAKEEILQVNVNLNRSQKPEFWAKVKELGITSMALENVCTANNKELMCSIRPKKGTGGVGDFMSFLALQDDTEAWQRSGMLRVKAPTKEVLRTIVEFATNCGLNVFTDTPRRWMDLDHAVGYRALPDPSAPQSQTVVIKSSVPTSAERMQAALDTIGYELDYSNWDVMVAGIKKKAGAGVAQLPPSMPHVFGPEHKGLILDYEGAF